MGNEIYLYEQGQQVSMDSLVRGDRKYVPETRYDAQQLRLLAYYRKMYVA